MAWARKDEIMAYNLVTEAESKRYRNECTSILQRTCVSLRKRKKISATFTLIGSGGKNLVTRNGDGPFDLDYNLEIVKAEDCYWDDLKLLKETVRTCLNRAMVDTFFKDAQDSTSCLTALLHFREKPDLEFSFDVAIVTRDEDGNVYRLIHNKNAWGIGNDQYVWNMVPNSKKIWDKAHWLKDNGLWEEVRRVYLKKKNMYLQRQDHNHPSYIVYVETINELYNDFYR